MTRKLTPLEYLILYVLHEAEQEAGFMGEEFSGLSEEQIVERIDAMPLDRRLNIVMKAIEIEEVEL